MSKDQVNSVETRFLEAPIHFGTEARAKALEPGDIHIWEFDLNRPRTRWKNYAQFLSNDEQARGARYIAENAKQQFIAGRVELRRLLGFYTETSAARLTFAQSDRGKPLLSTPTSDIQFNVSHSGNRVLLAITRIGPIGIDIERVKPIDDLFAVAKVIATPKELELILAEHGPTRALTFFRVWTRKEAALKASGLGITENLTKFGVFEEQPTTIDQHLTVWSRQSGDTIVASLHAWSSYEAAIALCAPSTDPMNIYLYRCSHYESQPAGS